ncbi:hypothetical protein [Psychrobacillus lasiicapitis]|uniref:SbsC C-terminal domain-containing protein n=1 Tax=Psychrobacillus lasiicapitis TaxID=1636719 RepID=A0A544TBS4_9BACI|nr:hypothetical protein [Psychrobacillus lasiicapitis]TQR14868.1 hypothetical protein FG382_05225 [Psychrobacillus lasiicapitis]GGA20594.1 hypothetical protein GCM10011384_07570 [Psychrobacillus lasiicapitis]
MSKRLIKQTTAAVLLTTSVLSFSSAALGATNSSVDQSVNKVKVELNNATKHYVYPSLDGKLAPSSKLYPALNSAKKNYQLTRSAVVSSKLSSAQKNAKLKEIDALYSEKISGGLVPYIDAYNYATKYLVPIMDEIAAAQERNDFAAVEKGYHKLSYQLKGRTAILYRFSGKAARELLLEEYKKPADAKRNELMVPVTITMKITEINDLLKAGKKAEAKTEFAEIEALLHRLPNASTNKFVAALLAEVAKVKAAVGDTTPVTPPVTPPVVTPIDPPATGGGGDDTPSQPSQQQVLNTKVASLVKLLNAEQSDIATASTTGSNSLTVKVVKEDLAVADFLGKGFYQTFTKQLGVTKVNGHNPTSLEAVTYITNAFPTGVTTLKDLKGQTVTLKITVDNGSPLDVNFKITFE